MKARALWWLALCSLSATGLAAPADGQEAFYSIPGPDGQVMIVRRPVKAAPRTPAAPGVSTPVQAPSVAVTPPVPTPSAPPKAQPRMVLPPPVLTPPVAMTPANAAPATPAAPPKATQSLPSAVVPASTPAPAPRVAPSPERAAVQHIDGTAYVDSEYLEQREFNPEGRKRFYPVNDGTGRVQVVERESGVNLGRLLGRRPVVRPVPTLAPTYRVLAGAEAQALLGERCFADLKLRRRDYVDAQDGYRGHVRPSPDGRDLTLVELRDGFDWFTVQSFTNLEKAPQFYWPLAIFLDDRRCVLEGASGFYQSRQAATPLQHSALSGALRRPARARYLLLTPLADAAELPGVQLAQQGQLLIQAVPVAP